MPRSLPPLTALRTFEAAARHGSFTRAARELHVTPAAVSHQIRGLEQYLGVTLFKRTTRRLTLTDEALAAAANLREAFERIGRGVDQLRTSGRAGSLSVGVTPGFAACWLVGRLGRFQKRHPLLQLSVRSCASPADFEHEDVDVAVRIGRGSLDGVSATPLFHEHVAPVASPGFLRSHPVRRPADVARMPLLHDGSLRRAGRPLGWAEWFRAAGVPRVETGRGTRFDDGQHALQAAAAGQGVALGRLVYAADDLGAKRLRIASPPLVKMDVAYYLLTPETRASLPAVVAFRSWMEHEAAAFRRSFEKLLKGRTIKPG
jgi:LysR family glycine cleavage system transcriptional activator